MWDVQPILNKIRKSKNFQITRPQKKNFKVFGLYIGKLAIQEKKKKKKNNNNDK